MKHILLASIIGTTVLLAGCDARTAEKNDAPKGMHKMADGSMMMDHDMAGMHEMPDGSIMKDDDAMDMDDMASCCKKCMGGADGMNCMGDKKGMNCMMMGDGNSMNHDDMTMGDMVDMLKGKTGDELDAAFLEGMIPHHQGAIDMAEFLLKNAKHEELKQLGRDIIKAQQAEIDMMKRWQKDWGYAK